MTAQAGSAALPSFLSLDRDSARREMRLRRRALPARYRDLAQKRFAVLAHRYGFLKPHTRVALYIAYGSEADPSSLLERARALRCAVHLPYITNYRFNRMSFVPYGPRDPLVRNRFGIPEPVSRISDSVAVRSLDVIFLPLIAVDERGNRMGSGAGFYDRALKHLRIGRGWRRPKLIGLAFECQRVQQIASAPWDVPLDALITEKKLYRFALRDQLAQGDV